MKIDKKEQANESEINADKLRVETTQKAGLFGNTQFTDLNGIEIGGCHYSCREAKSWGWKAT